MKVLITGSSGLIGTALSKRLTEEGHEVHSLVRRPAVNGHDIQWDPVNNSIKSHELEGFDGVIHLAGENIADGRWTDAKMDKIRDSRVVGTRFLSEALAGLERKPKVLVCASAIGFYGDRSDAILTDRARPGSSFLARVCEEWERACEPARAAGIRVVNLRVGIVLSKAGGALAKMLLPFQLGLAGRIGSGRQWMSWIELGDLACAIRHSLLTESLEGPVNAVSPQPVTNSDYTKTLGRVLSRPTILPLPALAAKLAFGKMAEELLLASIRVEPKALLDSGFEFEHPELDGAIRHTLGSAAG